jgi:hypothetical protein
VRRSTVYLAISIALTGVIFVANARAAQAICSKYPAAIPALTRLRAALEHGRFIAYEPTSLQVVDGQSTHADPDSIRADLKVLRPSTL